MPLFGRPAPGPFPNTLLQNHIIDLTMGIIISSIFSLW